MDLTQATPLHLMADALRARLAQVFPEERFQHGLLSARMTPGEWDHETRRAPYVGLGFDGFQPGGNGTLLPVVASWTVYLVNANARGVAARLRGDRLGPGCWNLLTVASLALHRLQIPDIGTVRFVSAAEGSAEGWQAQHMALGMVRIEIPTQLDFAALGTTLDEFLQLASAWDFPDGQPPLTDEINVRETE